MSTSTRTITTVRRPSAPRSVLLAARAQVDLHNKALNSTVGAQEIIAAIRARKAVTKLILSHNYLRDEGTRELFRFLCSEEGRRYRIAEISLNSNEIGNIGLETVADYLEGNIYLRELFLQNNAFQGDEEIATKFSLAINSSKLELLAIASNQHLSDTFFVPFLSHLDSPALRELQISAIGLTGRSAPALTDFFCFSSRSDVIEALKCNANALGTRAVRAFLAKLRATNFTLQKLELYANSAGDAHQAGVDAGEPIGSDTESETGEGGEESVEEARANWTKSEQEMKSMLLRNELLKRKVHEEALRLLTYSRALLMCSDSRSAQRDTSTGMGTQQETSGDTTKVTTRISNSSSTPLSECESPQTASSPSPPSSLSHIPTSMSASNSAFRFRFRDLPIELQQHILALLAPSLSAPQRARIFAYAADPSTLSRPLFLPTSRPGNLPNGSGPGTRPGAGGVGRVGRGCIPDPASLPFSTGGLGIGSGPGSPSSGSVSPPRMAEIGLGLGSLSLNPNPVMISQTLALSPNADTAGPRLVGSESSSSYVPAPVPASSSTSISTSTSASASSSPSPSPSPFRSPAPASPSPPGTSLGLCASGKCMGAGGSVLCHRAEIRMRWLADVGCTRFDAEGRARGRGRGREPEPEPETGDEGASGVMVDEVLWLIGQS